MTEDLFTWAESRPAPEPEPQEAEVVPFPQARRAAYIREKAWRIIEMDRADPIRGAEKALKWLYSALDKQRKTLLKRGISPEVVDVEIESLREAILAGIRPAEKAWKEAHSGQ